MRPALAASAALAVFVHGCVLFGLDFDQAATPLPAALGPVVVSLVAAGPALTGASPNPMPAPAAPKPPPAAPPERPRVERPRKPQPTPPRIARKPAPRAAPTEKPPAAEPAPTSGATGDGEPVPSATPGASNAGGPSGATMVAAVPRYRMAPPPEYPAAARRLRQEGLVLLAVEVSAQGKPTSVRVAKTSGVASLDEAAVRGVRRWRFDPARSTGLPVASRVEVPIRFDLHD